jgi:hypothetical protein
MDAIPRPHPHAKAPAEVRKIFHNLVSSVAPQGFRPGDADLVERYAQAIALSARLRLLPQNRTDPKVIGRNNIGRVSAYDIKAWDFLDDDK